MTWTWPAKTNKPGCQALFFSFALYDFHSNLVRWRNIVQNNDHSSYYKMELLINIKWTFVAVSLVKMILQDNSFVCDDWKNTYLTNSLCHIPYDEETHKKSGLSFAASVRFVICTGIFLLFCFIAVHVIRLLKNW